MPMNPGKERHGWLAFTVLVCCALAPSVASAQSDFEKKAQAKELYERATRLYDVGKYGDAIAAYEQAYLLVEDPALLYNIGQAYRLWDRPEEALRSYKNYLRKRPEASNRADVERKISDLERIVEDRRRSVGSPTALPAPQPSPQAPPEPANANPSPSDRDQGGLAPQVDSAGLTSQSPGAEPPRAEPPGVEPAGVVVQPPVEAPPAKRNWLAWGLVGGGAAGLLFSAAMAVVGAADAAKLRDASKNHEAFDATIEKNGKAANALAIVGLAAGVGAAGVGGYLLWRGHGAKGPTATLLPTMTPNYAGASALVTF
jgi:tetratricopeptide (TPR) repeat protein